MQRLRILAVLLVALVVTTGVADGQAPPPSIPPSAFIIAGGGSASPPPPPPPPSSDISVGFVGQTTSPPPASPPQSTTASPPSSPHASNASTSSTSTPPAASPPQSAPAPTAVTSASSGSSAPKSGSSGISGGAIAGIVIGALAGVAILAALAFFMMRRRRRNGMATIPSKMEAGSLGEDQDTVGALPPKNGDLHSSLAPLHSGYGLSWKEGDEVRDGKPQDGIRSSSQPSPLEDSLSEVPRSNTMAGKPPLSMSKDSDSYIQIMPDNTTVIVSRGPGGSVKIHKALPNSNGGLSNVSQGSDNSQAISIRTTDTGVTGMSGAGSRSSGTSVDLPELPWSDWEIKADDIIMAKDADGSPVKLGSGAYGTVYKATIDGVTEVAVKIFHDIHSQMQQADILREVAILKSCRDRNIVQFLGACIMDERIMLVTELMEAGDLWHALVQYNESGALRWYRRGRRIAIEVARGLHFLHRHKIIHFDLKSANVLLTRDGTAKISDVGFANILSNTHLSNNAQAFTFAWAAPEVLMGAACTDKVDIFSYGVLLWEIVTGQQPKRGQLRECRVPEECPSEVEELIQRCLSFEPEQRPNCKEIVEALSKLQDDPGPPGAMGSGSIPPTSNQSAPASGEDQPAPLSQ